MICPRCNDSQLVERKLDGLAIDVCSRCSGIWLDRGELEQLRNRELERYRHDDDNDDDDDRRYRYGDQGAPNRTAPKRSKWRGLLELFD
ncbi:MAG: hypothetical protein RL398_2016 [Planctomycetota bacterium]